MKKIALSFFPFFLAGFSFIGGENPVPGNREITEKQYDGPYVIYGRKNIAVKYIYENGGLKAGHIDNVLLSEKAGISLSVLTDEPGKTFTVQLKDKIQVEKSEFEEPSKIVAISDIEGNFRAFRELLQQSGVIDSNYNWTFGDGHLVLVGDFFDRGNQVTEVLWLIYSLEDKAKAAGGYVHFILGNHEIMNLSGDLRYVAEKYVQNAELLGENYTWGLYGKNSELGRWLRTKNIIEKIGDVLFSHAGISAEMNRMYIPSLTRINEIARPYYTDRTYIFNDQRLAVIFGEMGPLWYRGYYSGKPLAPIEQIDNTLAVFGVKHIVTGHSIVADTISAFHDGKLINLDVHHAAGYSEALLIEGEKLFRIDIEGKRFPLTDE
jgi:hypothetical protein